MQDEAHASAFGHGVRYQVGIVDESGLQNSGRQAGFGAAAVTASGGAGAQFLRASVGQNLPFIQYIHKIAAFCLVHVGRADQYAEPFTAHKIEQHRPQFLTGKRVDTYGRLVQQEQLGGTDKGTGQPQLLFHAAGESARLSVPEFVQIRHVQQIGQTFFSILPGKAVQIGVKFQIFKYGQIFVQAETLGHVADARLNLCGIAGRVHPEDAQRAAVGAEEAADHAHEGGFSRAVRPHQCDQGPGGDEQIHSLQRDYGLTGMPDAETFAQSPGFHSGCRGHGVYLLF